MSKVLIGIIGNHAARFHEFTASTLRLRRPENCDLEFLIGGDWCGARNTLAQATLDGGYSHLWFMDDDHSFSPDLLLRLEAWGKPLVTPICLQRVFPFAPVEYVAAPPELAHLGDFVPIDLSAHPGGGLIEIEAGGAAGMLISREVLEAVKENGRGGNGIPDEPWFEYGDQSEDVLFCEKAKAAGFTLYADLGARLGHITTCVVIPSYTDEHGWTTGLRIGKDYDIRVKQTYDLIEDGRREREPAAVSAIVEVPVETLTEPDQGGSASDQGEVPRDGRAALEVGPVPGSVSDDYYYHGCDALGDPVSPIAWGGIEPDQVGGEAGMGAGDLPAAERIEIWMDEELRWWWRAIDHEGVIIAQDSAVNEPTVIGEALSHFPGVSVHHIQREVDDSRNPKQYGPPTRLWNRGVQ